MLYLVFGIVENYCAFAMNSVVLLFIWLSPYRFHAPPLIFFCWASKYLSVGEFLSEGRRSAALSLLTRNLWKEQTGSTGMCFGKKDMLYSVNTVASVCPSSLISFKWSTHSWGVKSRGFICSGDVLEEYWARDEELSCGYTVWNLKHLQVLLLHTNAQTHRIES